jgi:large subunit ribosomal protein L21
MYAIFNHKGKQYKVSKNDFLKLPKLSDLKKNDTLTLEDIILLKTENGSITIGTPIIKDVKIKAKVIDQIRDNKIIVFKKKRRHNYRRKIGHRQDLTLVKIEEIITSSSSNKKLKEENQPKKEVSDGS